MGDYVWRQANLLDYLRYGAAIYNDDEEQMYLIEANLGILCY